MRATGFVRVPGGNACNSARVLAKLGHKVQLMSQLAEDSKSNWLIQQMRHAGIKMDLCTRSQNQTTPISSIWLNQQNGSRTIVHHRDLDEISLNDLQKLESLTPAWIHFEGRNIETLTHLFQKSKVAEHCPKSLEIEKPREGIEELLPWMSVVIISQEYLRKKRLSATECMWNLKKYNNELAIICTQGSDGLVAMDHSGHLITREAEPVDRIIDTIGAGDSFIAGLISALSQKKSFQDALVAANQLAALKIQHRGFDFHV